MLSLHTYIANTPRNILGQIHKRTESSGGLKSQKIVLEDCQNWACSKDRIRTELTKLLDSKDLFPEVFFSLLNSPDGLSMEDLKDVFSDEMRPLFFSIVDKLRHDFLILRYTEPAIRYFLPDEVKEILIDILTPEKEDYEVDTESGVESIEHKAELSFFQLRANLALSNLRLTQGGKPHAAQLGRIIQSWKLDNYTDIQNKDFFNAILELVSLKTTLHKADDKGLYIEDIQSILSSDEFAEESWNAFSWNWLDFKYQWPESAWKNLFEKLSNGLTTYSLHSWIPSTLELEHMPTSLRWESWPNWLKDLWHLGWVGYKTEDNVQIFTLTASGKTAFEDSSTQEMQAWTTPDLIVHLLKGPISENFQLLALCSDLDKDDQVRSFKLNEEKIKQALQAGVPKEQLQDLTGFLNFPPMVEQFYNSAINKVCGVRLSQGILIEIDDSQILATLSNIPEWNNSLFASFDTGVVANPKCFETIQKLLNTCGLQPAPLSSTKLVSNPEEAEKPFDKLKLSGELDYSIPSEHKNTATSSSREERQMVRANNPVRFQRMLELAIYTDNKMQLTTLAQAELECLPLAILRQSTPIRLEYKSIEDTIEAIPIEELEKATLL